MIDWKKRYAEAHENNYKRRTPQAYAAGYYHGVTMPKYKTANGLTKLICNYLLWTHNHGERTNNMGRPVKKYMPKYSIWSGKVEQLENGIEWQKGTGTKGTSDIKGHIVNSNHKFPIPIYVEVKIKDKQSDEQKDYEKQVTGTGALYCICRTPEDFFSFYDYCLTL